MSALRRVIAFCVGFVQEHTSSSSARLAGLLLTVTGCGVGAFTVRFAFLHPSSAAAISALAATTSALIGGGATAIFTRSRTGESAPPPGGGDPG